MFFIILINEWSQNFKKNYNHFVILYSDSVEFTIIIVHHVSLLKKIFKKFIYF